MAPLPFSMRVRRASTLFWRIPIGYFRVLGPTPEYRWRVAKHHFHLWVWGYVDSPYVRPHPIAYG